MKFESLRALHASMQAISTKEDVVDMQHFRLKSGAVEFDCLFSTRGRPFSLALTSRGNNPEFFLFQVSRDYEIPDAMSPDVFSRLAKTLKTTGLSGNKLIPRDFWASLDAQIPRQAQALRRPSPETIIALRPDIVDERDKPHFSHWQSPGRKADGTLKNVTVENKQKTLEMLGTDALQHSIDNHVSGHWSPVHVRTGWKP